MAALKSCSKIACLALLRFSLSLASRAEEPSSSLYAQATSTMLDRSFPSSRVEYLLADLRTQQTIAIRWPNAEKPIPVGSLLKPFVALSYNELHFTDSNAIASSPYYSVDCAYCRRHPEIWRRSIAPDAKSAPQTERDRLAFNRIHGWSAIPVLPRPRATRRTPPTIANQESSQAEASATALACASLAQPTWLVVDFDSPKSWPTIIRIRAWRHFQHPLLEQKRVAQKGGFSISNLWKFVAKLMPAGAVVR